MDKIFLVYSAETLFHEYMALVCMQNDQADAMFQWAKNFFLYLVLTMPRLICQLAHGCCSR